MLNEIIRRLQLEPHPEGGYFRETHRSERMLPREALGDAYSGDRSAVTSILFLLPTGEGSRLHRVLSEELWLHQGADALRLHLRERINSMGIDRVLGSGDDAVFQAVVPPGWWQEAEALPGPAGYALVGCVVAPGFDFEDFEMRSKD